MRKLAIAAVLSLAMAGCGSSNQSLTKDGKAVQEIRESYTPCLPSEPCSESKGEKAVSQRIEELAKEDKKAIETQAERELE